MEVNATGLQIGYGDYIVVEDFDILLSKHHITSIIGPNGSGKSTVLKALTRLLRYQKGAVCLDGKDLQDFGPKELARRIGVLPQMHSAPADFRVKELVGYGRMPHQGFFARMNGEDERIVDEAMKATGTYHLRDKSIHEISGGETQRVWIATVLTQQPEILFLDEPTTYLDIAQKYEVMELIRQINSLGKTVVMVLHDLPLAFSYSHQVAVLEKGAAAAQGEARQVFLSGVPARVFGVKSQTLEVDGREEFFFYQR